MLDGVEGIKSHPEKTLKLLQQLNLQEFLNQVIFDMKNPSF